MTTETELFGRADVIVMESDDEQWLFGSCTHCSVTLRYPSGDPKAFADHIVAHAYDVHGRAWLAIRFSGVDTVFRV